MAKDDADAFLATLKHPRKAEIEVLRAIIRQAEPELEEGIKWNAPSYRIDSDDRVTMNLSGGKLRVIFHRGAKAKPDKSFRFDDPSGLLEWPAPDRGVLTIADAAALKANGKAIGDLIRRWVKATRYPLANPAMTSPDERSAGPAR